MEFAWTIGGMAGAGIMVTGRTMTKAFVRGGYNVVGYPEYPSLVRGGHNVYQIRVSDEEINSPVGHNDVVVALNRDAVLFHRHTLPEGGVLIYDADSVKIEEMEVPAGIQVIAVPTLGIIEKKKLDKRMRNTVMMGATFGLLDYPTDDLEDILGKEFARKGREIVEKNIEAVHAGAEHVKKNYPGVKFEKKFGPLKKEGGKIVIGGNEAFGMGAIAAGFKFYSAYPMTPASNLLHYLAPREQRYELVVKQTEDEIAAVQYAMGAAYAGVRAMVGTSGGGFALMTETLGCDALSETPLVVYVAQRTGPSTGMPTWTEQADMRFILHASQGEFLRVVMAPGDMQECFFSAGEAFNLAEKYQIPVLVLTDKFNAESHFSTAKFDSSKIKIERGEIAGELPELPPNERFKRYAFTDSGVSPRPLPGTPNGMHVATSYEHREDSFSSEDFHNRKAQVDKRAKKIDALIEEIPSPEVYGEADADVAVICWGSQKLPAVDALPLLKGKGVKAQVIHFKYLLPIPAERVLGIFGKAKNTVLIENNSTGQFAGLLREHTGFVPSLLALKYDGRQWFPAQIAETVEEAVKGGFREKLVKAGEKVSFDYYNTDIYKEVK